MFLARGRANLGQIVCAQMAAGIPASYHDFPATSGYSLGCRPPGAEVSPRTSRAIRAHHLTTLYLVGWGLAGACPLMVRQTGLMPVLALDCDSPREGTAVAADDGIGALQGWLIDRQLNHPVAHSLRLGGSWLSQPSS